MSVQIGNFISMLWDTFFVARLLNASGQLLDHFKMFRYYMLESKKDRYFYLNVSFREGSQSFKLVISTECIDYKRRIHGVNQLNRRLLNPLLRLSVL
jgi:hypothetical protein